MRKISLLLSSAWLMISIDAYSGSCGGEIKFGSNWIAWIEKHNTAIVSNWESQEYSSSSSIQIVYFKPGNFVWSERQISSSQYDHSTDQMIQNSDLSKSDAVSAVSKFHPDIREKLINILMNRDVVSKDGKVYLKKTFGNDLKFIKMKQANHCGIEIIRGPEKSKVECYDKSQTNCSPRDVLAIIPKTSKDSKDETLGTVMEDYCDLTGGSLVRSAKLNFCYKVPHGMIIQTNIEGGCCHRHSGTKLLFVSR